MKKNEKADRNALEAMDIEITSAVEVLNENLGVPQEATGEGHSFTPKFETKMNHLVKKVEGAGSWGGRIAAVLAVALLTGFTWLSVDVQAGQAVTGWFRSAYETVFAYRFQTPVQITDSEQTSEHNHSSKTELRSYAPAWLPDNWVEVNRITDTKKEIVFYSDGTAYNNYFSYSVKKMDEDVLLGNAQTVIFATVKGKQAEFFPAVDETDTNTLVWQSEDTSVLFMIAGNATMEQMIKMAESVE